MESFRFTTLDFSARVTWKNVANYREQISIELAVFKFTDGFRGFTACILTGSAMSSCSGDHCLGNPELVWIPQVSDRRFDLRHSRGGPDVMPPCPLFALQVSM